MAIQKKLLSTAISAAALNLMLVPGLQAQESAPSGSSASAEIVEILTIGRLRTSADEAVTERQESAIVSDIIDSSFMTRIGDANVATALRRVPGVTLVDDKYVYVRGLGERYSNSLLNGARIPSPDLTRNVLPLDIFPTSVIQSVAVQKGYSAEMPAQFSGGLIDIRTKSIPTGLEYSLNLGTSWNSETPSTVLGYQGGGSDWKGTDDGTRAMPTELRSALDEYRGALNPISILNTLAKSSSNPTLAAAQTVNRNLATALNRDVDVTMQSRDPIYSMNAGVGNLFYFDNGLELGFVAGAAYSTTTNSRESIDRSLGQPEEVFANRTVSEQGVNLTGNLGIGARWMDETSIETTSLLLRNTDDEAFYRDRYAENSFYSAGAGARDYGVRYEERELRLNQIRGSHTLGENTRDLLHFSGFDFLTGLEVSWYFSDAVSETSIPNEARISYQIAVDPATGQTLSRNFAPGESAAEFRFTELEDNAEDYGWSFKLPLYFKRTAVDISGGNNVLNKARVYSQYQFRLGSIRQGALGGFNGDASQVLGNSIITNPDNGFVFDVNPNNGESYLAGVVNTSAWGKVDVNFDETWRVAAGLRWEDYNQVGIPWNPLRYSGGCQITCDPAALEDASFKSDDYFPSVAVTHMRPGFLAETFQFRLGYSETLVRPDLREITPSSYLDPITGAIVAGNSNVIPAGVKNYDIRAEWFFGNGDNFTTSLFYKDIVNPIDFFEAGVFEGAKGYEIHNGQSASMAGLELEWMKNLSFIGTVFDPFFVSGNLVIVDSNLVVDPTRADAPTNLEREMPGASDSINLQLGFDSDDGRHSAMLSFNMATARLYYAGRNGSPDAFEQPFQALDLTYFWYPTDNLVVRLRAQNILDETRQIEQGGVKVFEEKPGMGLSFDVQWKY
jgi:TonB-dependent receptor